MEEYAVITQRIDCVFGSDHQITVKINDDRTLSTVSSTCSADKAETEGLILLGTDKMKTCLGYMECFINHSTGKTRNTYDLPKVYKDTVLSLAATPLANEILSVQRARLRLKEEEKRLEEAVVTDNLVSRRLGEYMQRHLGAQTKAFSIRKEENGCYTFCAAGEKRYDASRGGYYNAEHTPIADRVDGVWVLRNGWDSGKLYNMTNYYGGKCSVCLIDGRTGHDESAGHIRKVNKAAFIGMQATSKEGMRIHNEGILDKDGEPFSFTYRKNTKKLVGVTFAPTEEEIARDYDIPKTTTY